MKIMKILNYSIIESLATIKNKGFLLKILFYKTQGSGKIYYRNFLDKSFINSLKEVLYLLKFKYFYIYKMFKNYNIYIKIIPKEYIYSGYSVNLSLFINFFCLYKEIKFKKNIIIIGSLTKSGLLRKLIYIKKKFYKIILKNKIIILKKNSLNYNKLIFYKNKYNLNIITFTSLNNLIDILDLKNKRS